MATKLRSLGISVEIDNIGRSLKAQMKYANKLNVRYTIILGEDELKNGKVKMKNMDTGEESAIELDKIYDEISE
jgi:histidyl-tRNA synthetase